MKYISLGFVVGWGVLSAVGAARGEDVDVPIQQRWTSSVGGVDTAGRHVIQDADAWTELWGKIHRISRPAPKLPGVDFEKQTVLAVFMGRQRTGGHSIRIASVRDTGSEVIVRVKTKSPPPGAMVTMALTHPYDVVAIAKTSKPVKFEDAAAAAPPKKRPPEAAARFLTIEVGQSGGFAGVMNHYVIRGDGSFEFKQGRRKKPVEGKLSKKDLAALSLAISKQDWSKVPDKMTTPRAADLFVYAITVQAGGKTHRIVCDDISAKKVPAVRAIIRTLAVVR